MHFVAQSRRQSRRCNASGATPASNPGGDRHYRPVPCSDPLQTAAPAAAEHWAVIASPIGTCKLIGVEPHSYLADVITRIVNGHTQNRLDDLMPWAYPVTPLQLVA
jgi:hypothetical protein